MRYSILICFTLLSTITFGKTWKVGPSRTYTAPSKVSGLVSDGDTVAIDSSTYSADVCKWTANNLTLMGIGGRPTLDAHGTSYGGKAIWVIGGNNTSVINITFANCACASWNGAGIRQEGIGLTVRKCYFHDNEDGILAGDNATSDILIEYTEFNHNGHGDGYSHNLYINHVRSLTFRYNYSHHARIGHELKSRAYHSYILYNRFSDEDTGTASRSIDLPNGGHAVLIGNIIEQGPLSQNSNIMEYGLEGLTNPDSSLFIINNTFANDLNKGSFIVVQNGTQLTKIYNNIFAGNGSILSGTITKTDSSNNIICSISNAGFTDAKNYDYHLLSSSIAINKGGSPGNDGMFSLTPIDEYVHPANMESRPSDLTLDVGAYEYAVVSGIQSEQNNYSNFRIFPNPTSGKFTIVLNSDNHSKNVFELYNIQGQLLWSATLENTAIKGLSPDINLIPGIYILKLNQGEAGIRKIIVQ